MLNQRKQLNLKPKTCLTLKQAALHNTEVHPRDPRGGSLPSQVLKAHLNLGARLHQPSIHPPQSLTEGRPKQKMLKN